jgi:alkylation response protein AidB-like acyl-CoA dehydrogenase
MEFGLSEEQQELAATVAALLDKRADSAAVRQATAGEPGYDEALWQTMCEQIGVAALAIPEEYDGFGASLFETAVVLEEEARALLPSPLLATSIATATLLLHGTDDQRSDLLPRIAAGTVATAVLEPPLVLEPAAEIVLVPRGENVEVGVDRPEPRSPLDPTLRLGHLATEADPSQPLLDVATALVTAAQLGCARRGLDMTVAYSQERVQFGRPIGSFQALKHRMADLLVLLEMTRSASWAATGAAASYLREPTTERAATLHERATVAKAWCSDALDTIAGETVQLHGGIAITWEHDAHLVLKRAHALGRMLGQAHEHRARLEL